MQEKKKIIIQWQIFTFVGFILSNHKIFCKVNSDNLNRKGNCTMSQPKPPYYYKDSSDTYHWETSCSKNHYPAPGWNKTGSKPPGREQCNECKGK